MYGEVSIGRDEWESILTGTITSKERTFWEQAFCPLFGGCPYLGGSLNYIV